MPVMSSEVVTETIASARRSTPIRPVEAPPQNEDDHFFWTYTEEPHRTRRTAIIKAHPEV